MNTFPWHSHYPKGVAHTIDYQRYPNLLALMEEAFQKYGNAPAYHNMGVEHSYAQLDKMSRDFAAYLQSLGLKKGDKFAIQMPNVTQYPVALMGALRAGLTVVNINPLYTVPEMTHQYNDATVKAVIIMANFADKLQEVLPKTQVKHVIVTEIGDLLGTFKGMLTNAVVKYVKKMVPPFHIPGAVGFKRALQIGAKSPYTRPEVDAEDLAFLQYTGGTTGVSKGAMLSHRNMLSNLLQSKEWFIGVEEGKEVAITALPLYHIFALTINCFLMLFVGAKSVLVTNPRDMPGFVKTLQQNPFTIFTGLNTLFVGLMNTPGFDAINFSKVKFVVGGGMAVQRATAERWKAITGKSIAEGYGLSETAPVLSVNPLDGNERLGSIGLPVPSTELAILDDDGKPVPAGERGEICARGPQVMQGYWQRPDETAKVFFEGGWFRTGDIGMMDDDGYFRIVDRKKEMILVSGFNVYPNEVEDAATTHPGVLEAAAIGVPDDKSTERVKLFVVRKDPNLTAEELIKHCKDHLAGYKVPREIVFREELPKTNVGKILRRKLKEEEDAAANA
ncbi:AMP-binding protein [Eisenibacter elegans]|jgi:long-chain acyl-CoA synthetase|uniref:AMP-binding protein n=1 Tax=Eisenibacter elegans TaxID=997 RepID=UPI0003FC6352|nr:AMP-binding protein [Eisenibacter elegans]